MIPVLDTAALLFSVGLVAAYYGFLRWQVRKNNPHYTVHAVNTVARAHWVETVMASGKMDVLAVQTLRNSVMAASFMASTAILLIIGALTLSGGDRSGQLWHALNPGGTDPWLVTLKLLLLLSDFFFAFFCFSMAVRFFNHVGYMINVPAEHGLEALAPARVARYLNRAGRYYTLGMRAFFICVPLVFWFFGPHFMVVATVALTGALHRLDRAPDAER
jgi:uncharacterized membrane protein